MIRFALVATVVASVAHAQEFAPGVTFGDAAFTTGQGTPLWVTEPYLVVTTGGDGATLKCVGAGDVTQRNLLTTGEWIEQRLAVNRATDEMYLVSATFREPLGATRDGIQIVRTDCETRLDVLHSEDASAPDWDLALSFRSGTFQLGLLPMANDGALYLPADDGIYLWSVDAPATDPALIAPMDAFTTAVLAAYEGREDDDPFDVHAHAAPDGLTWDMDGGVALDDGSLLASFVARGVPMDSARAYLFRVERTGVVTLIWRIAPSTDIYGVLDRDGAATFDLTTSTFSTELGGFLVSAGQSRGGGLGILPTDRPDVLSVYPRPILPRTLNDVFPLQVRYVAATGRRPFAWTREGNVRTIQPIEFDLTQVDFDGDGIRWTDEVAMGLDDRAVDHDGDGFFDGIERVLYGTDPGSAASVPSASLDTPTVGFSARLGDWLFNQEPLRSESSFGYGVICPSMESCLDGRRRPTEIRPSGTAFLEVASASADGRIVNLFNGGDPLAWLLADGVSFGRSDTDILRETASGSFAVLQPSRTECPFMNDARDTARCSRPESRIPDGFITLRLGYAPPNEAVIVGLDTLYRGWPALATTDASTTEVFMDGRVFQGWDPEQIIPLDPENGSAYLIEAFRDEVGSDASRRWYLADANFVPRQLLRIWPSSFALGNGIPIGGRFDRGPVIHMRAAFSKPNSDFGGGGSCTRGAMGAFTCGRSSGTPAPFVLDWHSMLAQLVEVDDRLQPGEILVAHAGFRDGVLSRLTQEGAYVPWLTIERLDRLMGSEVRFVEKRDVSIAPDVSKVCMVDALPGPGSTLATRVWEIGIEDGRPSTARVAYEDATNPPLACAYDEAGTLHWAIAGELVAETGERLDTNLDLTRHVHRIDGTWVLIGDLDGHELATDPSAEAICVDDSGAVTDLGAITAISELDGIMHVLDAFGVLTVIRTDDLCNPSASGPRESALVPVPTGYVGETNLWAFLYEQIFEVNTSIFSGQVDWRVEHATMITRPDGAVVIFPGVSWYGRGPRPRAWAWWLRPSYWPDDPNNRIEELDPLRRDEDFANVLTEEIFTVPAAARVPGEVSWPDESYEWFDRPAPRPRDPFVTSGDAGPTMDAGAGDAGTEGGGKGCGCTILSTSDATSLAPLVLLVWAFRRRD